MKKLNVAPELLIWGELLTPFYKNSIQLVLCMEPALQLSHHSIHIFLYIRLDTSSANLYSVCLSTIRAVPSNDLEFTVNLTLGLWMIF
jgi:hypothetical protein